MVTWSCRRVQAIGSFSRLTLQPHAARCATSPTR
jgi:hypothetical protein